MIIEDVNDTSWYLDTKTTNHMSHDIESFLTYNKWENEQLVYLDDNSTHQIIRQGNVSIKLNNGQVKEVTNVLHVLKFYKNLFFAKQFYQTNGKIVIKFNNYNHISHQDITSRTDTSFI
jgi:hypothetical protein